MPKMNTNLIEKAINHGSLSTTFRLCKETKPNTKFRGLRRNMRQKLGLLFGQQPHASHANLRVCDFLPQLRGKVSRTLLGRITKKTTNKLAHQLTSNNFKAEGLSDLTPIRKAITNTLLSYVKNNDERIVMAAACLVRAALSIAGIATGKGTSRYVNMAGLAIDLAMFYTNVFGLNDALDEFQEVIYKYLPSLLENEETKNIQKEASVAVDSNPILVGTTLASAGDSNGFARLMMRVGEGSTAEQLQAIWNNTNPGVPLVIDIHAENPQIMRDLAAKIDTDINHLVGTDLLTKYNGANILPHLKTPIARKIILCAQGSGITIPLPNVGENGHLYYPGGSITNMCFFYAIGVIKENKTDMTLPQIIDMIKTKTGFDIWGNNKMVNGELQFPGINQDEARSIAENMNIGLNITYGNWSGMKEGGYFASSGVVENVNHKEGCKVIPVYYLTSGAYGCHWMASRFIPPVVKAESFDIGPVFDLWPKFLSWIFTIGTGLICSKVLKHFKLDSSLTQAMANISRIGQVKTQCNELETFVKENFFGIESEKTKVTKEMLELEKQISQAIAKPAVDYYAKPYLLQEFDSLLDKSRATYAAHSGNRELQSVSSLLNGAITAGTKYIADIRQNAATRRSRIVPTVIMLVGAEGVGKTVLVHQLARELTKKHGYPEDSIYTFRPTKFFPPYHQEPIGFYDEAFNKKDSRDDIMMSDMNSVVSNDPYNMEGASLVNKVSPCAFEYLFMATNVPMESVLAKLNIEKECIPAFWSRIRIYECIYNQGPDEEKKSRNERKRLPRGGHIDFYRMKYNEKGGILKSTGTNTNDTTHFKRIGEKLQFDDILTGISEEYAVNRRNHELISSPDAKAEGDAINHFVVNLNGPPGYGKTEAITRLRVYFQNFGMNIVEAKVGEYPKMDRAGLVIVDDQILLNEKKKVNSDVEMWYMELYNRLPRGCVIVVATNIECKNTTYRVASKNPVLAAASGLLKKVRKHPFTNVGMLRRMGYCGLFADSVGVREIVHNLEFHVDASGYKTKDVKEKGIYACGNIASVVSRKYLEFLEIFSRVHVMYNPSEIPAFTPNIEIYGNSTIIEEVTSTLSLWQMMNNGTSKGNRMVVKPEVMEAMKNVDAMTLIPGFTLEYTSDSVIELIQHYIKIIRPVFPNVAVKIQLDDLPAIYSSGNFVYVLSEGASAGVQISHFDFGKDLVYVKCDGTETPIDFVKFYMAMRQSRLFNEFSMIPVPVVDCVKNMLAQAPTCYPLVYSRIRKIERNNIKTTIKRDMAAAGTALYDAIKKHPYFTTLVGLFLGLFAIRSLWKLIRPKEEKQIKFGKSAYKKIIYDLAAACEKAHRFGDEEDFKQEIDIVKKMDPANLDVAFSEMITEARGKNKPYRRTVVRVTYKKYFDGKGNIYYADGDEVVGVYNKHGDYFQQFTPGSRRIEDDWELLEYGAEGVRAIAEIARGVIFGKAAQGEAIGPIEQSPFPPIGGMNTSFRAIVKKFESAMVYVSVSDDHKEDRITVSDSTMLPSVYGIGMGGRIIMAPRHVIAGRKNTTIYINDYRVFERTKQHEWFAADLVWQANDFDTAIWRIRSKTFQAFPDLTKYIHDGVAPGIEVSSMFLDCSGEKIREYYGLVESLTSPMSYSQGTSTINSKNCGYVSYAASSIPLTTYGSCGFPYFDTSAKDSKIFMGMHVASNSHAVGCGSNYYALVQLVDKDFKAKLAKEGATGVQVEMIANSGIPYCDPITNEILTSARTHDIKHPPLLPQPQTDSVEIIGTNARNLDRGSKVDKFHPTPYSRDVRKIIPIEKVPCEPDITKLSKEELAKLDRDAQGKPCIVTTQENMWSDPIGPGESAEVVKKVIAELEPVFNGRFANYRVLTDHEVMNGISNPSDPANGFEPFRTDTSIGYMSQYMWNLNKKSDVIHTNPTTGERTWRNNEASEFLQDSIRKAETAARGGRDLIFIYKNVKKVEKLPVEKRWKLRIFTIADIRGVYLERKYFGAYIQSIANDAHNYNQLGMKQESFDIIAKKILAIGGRAAGCDYSRYDKHIHPVMNEIITGLYSRAVELVTGDEEAARAVASIARQTDISYHATLNTFYKKKKGLNSGCVLTQVKNSDYNFLYIFFAWMKLAPPNMRTYACFDENVVFHVYGDDLHIAVRPTCERFYSIKKIADYLHKTWGMVLDSADKDGKENKYQPLANTKFVSRQFREFKVPNGTHFWVGALKKESIGALLHWTTDLHPIQLASQYAEALWEGALWGKDYYKQIITSLFAAIKRVPALCHYLVIHSFESMAQEIYNDHFNRNGTRPFNYQNFKYSLQSENFDRNIKNQIEDYQYLQKKKFAMGNCIKVMSAEGIEADYVSLLNRAWQAGYITTPLYTQESDCILVMFDVNKTHCPITGKGSGKTRKEQKQAAAKDAYEKWQATRIAKAESGEACAGKFVKMLNDTGIPARIDYINQPRQNKNYTPKLRRPRRNARDNEMMNVLTDNMFVAHMEFVEWLWNHVARRPVCIYAEDGCAKWEDRETEGVKHKFCPKNCYVALLNDTWQQTFVRARHFKDFYSAQYPRIYAIGKRVYINPLRKEELEAEMEKAGVGEAKLSVQPDGGTSSSAGGGSENTVPQTLYPLPAQTAASPSVTLSGAGEVTGTHGQIIDCIELNPDSQPPDIPTASGRAFSLEEFLWNQWVPLDNASFTNNSARGDVLFTQSAAPSGLSSIHTAYSNLHKNATFATECMYIINGAQNVAGTLLLGWVRDISKSEFTVDEIMSTSWKIIDVNGNKTIKLCVRDARQSSFYRDLDDDGSVNPIPGIVVMVLSPLNNMYSTDGTYAVQIQRYCRFAEGCMFFNPKTAAEITTTTATSIVPRSLLSGITAANRFQLSLFDTENFQLFVGGSTMPKWDDTNDVAINHVYNLEFHPSSGLAQPLMASIVEVASNPDRLQYNEQATALVTFLVDGTHVPQDRATVIQNVNLIADGETYYPQFNQAGAVIRMDGTQVLSSIPRVVELRWGSDKNGKPTYGVHLICFLNKHALVGGNFYNSGAISAFQIAYGDNQIATNPGAGVTGPYSWRDYVTTNTVLDNIMVVAGRYTGYANTNMAVSLGETTITSSTSLSGRLKYCDMIAVGQSGLNASNALNFPIRSAVGSKLAAFLENIGSLEFVSFDIFNITGKLASVTYWKRTGFLIPSDASNILTAVLDPSSLWITNIKPTNAPASTQINDYTPFTSFVSTVTTMSGKIIRVDELKAEASFLASMALSGVSGLFGGLAAANRDQLDRNWNSSENTKNRQNTLDNTNLANSGNLAVTQQQGANSLANIDANGTQIRQTEALRADLSLRNAGILGTMNSGRAAGMKTPTTSSANVRTSQSTLTGKATGKVGNSRLRNNTIKGVESRTSSAGTQSYSGKNNRYAQTTSAGINKTMVVPAEAKNSKVAPSTSWASDTE